MERITRKDAEQTLRVYCQRAGVPFGHYIQGPEDGPDTFTVEQSGRSFTARRVNESGKLYALEGGYALAGAYGGWQVQRIDGTDGAWRGYGRGACTGVSTPFASGYVTPREIVTMLRGAIAALEIAEGTR